MAMQLQKVLKSTYQIVNTRSLSTIHAGIIKDGKTGVEKSASNLHVSAKRDYPLAVTLPLPDNINDESAYFSPQRTRDITQAVMQSHQSTHFEQSTFNKIDITSESDPHVQSYDCMGAVNLNSSMQSNVPTPFCNSSHYMHLNMPGGQWEQWSKYVSNDLQCSHYVNLRQEYRDKSNNKPGIFHEIRNVRGMNSNVIFNKRSIHTIRHIRQVDNSGKHLNLISMVTMKLSTQDDKEKHDKDTKRISSRTDMLKKAVKDYGSTVIVFHVSISLMSLGVCYLCVSSGLDVAAILEYLGMSEDGALSKKVATGAGTFVAAYAIHKVFAPVRISITLASTPFIVRYLRRVGILKPPSI